MKRSDNGGMPEAGRERLKQELSQAIRDFNRGRLALLQKAFEEGGGEAVTRLENEYDALRDAYFEVLRRRLDSRHHCYRELMMQAGEQVKALRESLGALRSTVDLLKGLDRTLSALGRVLIVLGL